MKIVFFLLTIIALITHLPAQCGDVDDSGAVDSVDLVALANHLAGNLDQGAGDFQYPPRADATQNGLLSVVDLDMMLLFVTGNIGTLLCSDYLAGDLYATDTIVGDLYYVPAGTFTQGSPSDVPCRYSSEEQFTHTLTRNLAVMETEVTQEMWEALDAVQSDLPDNPSYHSGTDRPVETVTWYEAVLFANLLSLQQGFTQCYYTDDTMTAPIDVSNYDNNNTIYCHFSANGYRLPTEGEWEYFCRAGTTGPFWVDEPNYDSGNCDSCTGGLLPYLEQAAVFCANAPAGTAVVGGKDDNPWGLRDVYGNVSEWCWDWFYSYPSGSEIDYTGPGIGFFRVDRGGGWGSWANLCRSAFRNCDSPDIPHYKLGFRLVREAE